MDELAAMSLDEFVNVEVTSAARYGQPWLDAMAAITVLTGDEIRRSGLRELPEILRLVPGLNVARTLAGFWSITSRGFSGSGATKMLVLVDGRSVYDQSTADVVWGALAIAPEDLERLEAIRGPGGALWGYNAVNGVVNIITRKASETPGLLVRGGGGTTDTGFAGTRLGSKINDKSWLRLYYDYFQQGGFQTRSGLDARDAYHTHRGGVRIDGNTGPDFEYTFDTAVFDHVEGMRLNTDIDPDQSGGKTRYGGGHVLGRALWRATDAISIQGQVYLDRADLTYGESVREPGMQDCLDTLDAELQMNWRTSPRNLLIWGTGARKLFFDPRPGWFITKWLDYEEEWNRVNVFVQDEFAIVPNRLSATLGMKVEYNDQTGYGWQPSARLLFKPTPAQSLWASVSRALRVPSFEQASRFEYFWLVSTGEPVRDEELIAWEIGYRNLLTPSLSLDLSLFYNDYDHIRTWEASLLDKAFWNNYDSSAETYGFELAVHWKPLPRWSLRGSYSFLYADYQLVHYDGTIFDPFIVPYNDNGDVPRHQFQIHSQLDLPWSLEFDTHLYWTDALDYTMAASPILISDNHIPSFFRLDLRLAWRPEKHTELTIVGQNLLEGEHTEFWDQRMQLPANDPASIPRSVYGMVTYRY